MVKITDAALVRFREILSGHPGQMIRFSVRSGGCNGFVKDLSVDTAAPDDLIVDDILAMDPITAGLVQDVTIDWVRDISGDRFDISVASAKSSCGCGDSFGI